LLVLAVVLQLLRLGWTASLNSIWAEDGPIFLQGALTQSFWHEVFSPYTNYLVLVPHLIGEAASLVPLREVPATISILSATLASLSGLAVWHASSGHIRNPYLRGALAALIVLVPVGGLESLDSAAYVSWYMVFASFWLLLWRPRTAWGAGLGSLFLLATALSNVTVWFFIPVAALRALCIRGRRDLMVVGSFALGVAIQVPVAVSHGQAATPTWTNDIWSAYLQRVLDGAVFGLDLGGIAWSHLGWPFLTVLLLCSIIGITIGIWRSSSGARLLAAIAISTSFVMFVLSAYQREVGTVLMWPAHTYWSTCGRYVIVPTLLLVCAALVLIDESWRRSGGRRSTWLVVATVTLMVLAIVTSFDQRDLVMRGTPQWGEALKRAASTCERDGLREVSVPTAPPSWSMVLACDRLTSFSDRAPPR